jgi:uncharacterized protein (TIGR00369 family)
MNRPFRLLSNFFLALWLSAAFATVALWLRSYCYHDSLVWTSAAPPGRRVRVAWSSGGWLHLYRATDLDDADTILVHDYERFTDGTFPNPFHVRWKIAFDRKDTYFAIDCAHWHVALACSIYPLIFWGMTRRARRAQRRLLNNHCPECGYDLRASPDRCPECGHVIIRISSFGFRQHRPLHSAMPLLELPHTPNCLVCGRSNPLGLHLSLHVDDGGTIRTTFTPGPHHVGFEGLIHGGLLATVLDEAMVWAAIWSCRRACVAGELNVRYRRPGRVGRQLRCAARVVAARSRMIEVVGDIEDAAGDGASAVIATATGKYVPLPAAATVDFFRTLVHEPATQPATVILTTSHG